MTRLQRTIAICTSVALGWLLLIGGTPGGMTQPEMRITSLGLATLALGSWVVVAGKRPAWRPRSVFLPVLIAALCSLAISAAWSRSPRIGLESLSQAAILGSGYLLLVELLRRPGMRTRLLFTACSIGLLVALAYIATILVEWLLFWHLVGRFETPPLRPDWAGLVYANPAPLLAVVTMLSASFVAVVGQGRSRVVVGVAALALLVALLTGTRAGWLSIAAGIGSVVIVAARRGDFRAAIVQLGRSLVASRRAKVIAAALFLLVSGAATAVAPGVLVRFASGGEEVRSAFYVASIRMWDSSPLVGVGPGLWSLNRALNTVAGESDVYAAHGHDLYLQSLASTGILGLIVGAIGVLTIVWLIRNGLKDALPGRRRWALVACFTCSYFAAHQALDFHAHIPAVLVAFALPLALLDATATARPQLWTYTSTYLALRGRNVTWIPVAVTALLAIAFAWYTIPATVLATYAAKQANAGDWVVADWLARRVRQLDPTMPEYLFLEGVAAAHNGDNEAALAALATFADFTDLPEAWVDVAQLRLQRGDVAGANDGLRRGARLGNQHPAIAIAITDLALRTGNATIATQAAAAAIAGSPSLASDPWWFSNTARSATYSTALAEALEQAGPEGRWEIKLMSGDPVGAKDLAVGSSDPALAREIIDAWSGDVDAVDRVLARCDSDPLSGPMAWCARVAFHFGQDDLGARYRRLAAMLRIPMDQTGELRAVSVLGGPSVAGQVAYAASGRSSRHEAFWDLLIPGVVRVELVPQTS